VKRRAVLSYYSERPIGDTSRQTNCCVSGRILAGRCRLYTAPVNSIGAWQALPRVETTVPTGVAKAKVIEVVQTVEFRSQVGPASNTVPKLKKRVEIIQKALSELAA